MPTAICPQHGPYEIPSSTLLIPCPECVAQVDLDRVMTCPKLFTGSKCDGTCIICTGDVKPSNQTK